MIYLTATFSITLNDPCLRFQGHAISDAKYLRNGTIYNIVSMEYTRPTQQCRYE